MAAPATLVRQRVKQIIDAEFAPEGIVVEDDKLVRAAGSDGRTRCACYPDSERANPRNVSMLVITVTVQLYLAYTAEPDENIVVNPTTIEGYADRLRRAFGPNSTGAVPDLWALRLDDIEYPDDPTGNRSRLEATIVAQAQNPASL